MAKKKSKLSSTDEISAGRKASEKRMAVRTVSELISQAKSLRQRADALDKYANELSQKNMKQFTMDGVTKFDRADKLLRGYLEQVNRWIGAAEHR
jgi:hypothetical protein